jgi:hypothetical protein
MPKNPPAGKFWGVKADDTRFSEQEKPFSTMEKPQNL